MKKEVKDAFGIEKPLPQEINPIDNYKTFKIIKGDIEDYDVITKIGRGRFSEVFEGKNIKTNQEVIIKILKPIKKEKIQREVKILSEFNDTPHMIRLLDVVKDKERKIYCLIFESIHSVELKEVSSKITDHDLRLYIYKILECLKHIHSKGIMHRDIKPGNIIVNNTTKELRVIDWGLAEYYYEGFAYNLRVGSRYYKAPELLTGVKLYDYGVDMWSVGCLFAAILFQKNYFFKGEDLPDQLRQIVKVLGKEEFDRYCQNYVPKEYLRAAKNGINKYCYLYIIFFM